jgi:hypothetical protein
MKRASADRRPAPARRACAAAVRVARFLLPQRDAVEQPRHHGGALHHLHQARRAEVGQQQAKTAPPPTMPTSSITYISATTRGRRPRRGEVGGQRQAGGLRGLHAGADQQEGQRRGHMAEPGRAEFGPGR